MKIKPFSDHGDFAGEPLARTATDGSTCPARLSGCSGRIEIAGICRECYQRISAAMAAGSAKTLPGER